ncbi:MAG: hypothetical protein HQ543_09175 [Bacteroidetes bacterium]|nr:hypothetical protein [Bacteroidota bacterium]
MKVRYVVKSIRGFIKPGHKYIRRTGATGKYGYIYDKNIKKDTNTSEVNLKESVNNAKRIFNVLSSEYNIKVPVIFKNLKKRGSGYIETTRLKGGKYRFIDRIIIDSTGLSGYDPDYALIHEVAHAILIKKKNIIGHTKEHSNLVHKLAERFDLV